VYATQYDLPLATGPVIVTNGTTVVLQDSITNVASKTTFAPIVFAGARYDRFVASGTYTPPTRYDLRDPGVGSVKRDDLDLSVGYLVLPSVALAIAYKRVSQDRTSSQPDMRTTAGTRGGFVADGVALGASASVPLAGKFSFYGNVSFGLGKARLDAPDAAGDTRLNVNYRNGEVGLSYMAYEGSRDARLKNVVISAGYRAQVITTKDLGLGTFSVESNTQIGVQKRDITSTTDGVVLGILAIF